MNDIKLFSEYAAHINDSYIVDDIGIDLIKLGKIKFDKSIPVNLKGRVLIDLEIVKNEFVAVIDFVEQMCYPVYSHTKPIWYRINVLDQAHNDYIGIGFLDIEQDWISFAINYLSCELAEQSGDCIIVIFDREFTWALSFTLSQDNSKLQAELFKT